MKRFEERGRQDFMLTRAFRGNFLEEQKKASAFKETRSHLSGGGGYKDWEGLVGRGE